MLKPWHSSRGNGAMAVVLTSMAHDVCRRPVFFDGDGDAAAAGANVQQAPGWLGRMVFVQVSIPRALLVSGRG